MQPPPSPGCAQRYPQRIARARGRLGQPLANVRRQRPRRPGATMDEKLVHKEISLARQIDAVQWAVVQLYTPGRLSKAQKDYRRVELEAALETLTRLEEGKGNAR